MRVVLQGRLVLLGWTHIMIPTGSCHDIDNVKLWRRCIEGVPGLKSTGPGIYYNFTVNDTLERAEAICPKSDRQHGLEESLLCRLGHADGP